MGFLRLLHGLFISLFCKGFMRCDLHVHSIASGMCDTPFVSRVCRESYNDPQAVYARLKRIGMSLVTLTDHDSIAAAEALRRYSDCFLSEEVTVTLPSGTAIHLGVYGITERDHTEIQRRREDFVALLMYLTERKLFFSVNHMFSSLTGRRKAADFRWFASYAPAFETRNGQMWHKANDCAEALALRLKKARIGGSDSHTIDGVGRTFTEVPAARSVDEFLAGLRAGRGIVRGEHGGYMKLTADIFRISKEMFRENPLTLAMLPLAVLVPIFTFGHWVNEIRFCRKWSADVERKERAPRMLWDMDSTWDANWAS